MEEREHKPRSEKRRATQIVACRLYPHEFRDAEAAARALGLKSAGVLARRLLIGHLARPRLDPWLLRDLALTLDSAATRQAQRGIIAQMIEHLDEAGA